MSQKSDLLLITLWSFVFLLAGVWPLISGEPFPLPGLRKLAASDDFSRLSQVLAVLVAGTWLAFNRWQTQERLFVFQGVALALWIQGFLYIGVPFGMAFACFGHVARGRCIQNKRT